MSFLLTFVVVFAMLIATSYWRGRRLLKTTPVGAYGVVVMSWIVLAATALAFSYLLHAVAWLFRAD